MQAIAANRTPSVSPVRWALAAIGVLLLLGVAVARVREGGTAAPQQIGSADARCAEAIMLITVEVRWPVRCRWRLPDDGLEGQAYPPPKGLPPYDDPRVEIYVDPGQDAAALAHAIAHELGHMHHTRDPRFVPEWLAARGLPPDTRDEVWTEDYAEVYAALFSPPSGRWRAPTPKPDSAELAELRARFFTDA